MRIALPLLAAWSLVSCGESAPADEPLPPEGEALETMSQPMGPGLYAVGDGTQVYAQTRLGEDGTYTDLDADGNEVGNGTWSNEGEAICFNPDAPGEAGEKRCWLNDSPDEDGSFITRRVGAEESYRVTPLED